LPTLQILCSTYQHLGLNASKQEPTLSAAPKYTSYKVRHGNKGLFTVMLVAHQGEARNLGPSFDLFVKFSPRYALKAIT